MALSSPRPPGLKRPDISSSPSPSPSLSPAIEPMFLTLDAMTDGLNGARAMRVAEVISDFRNLQHHIAGIRVDPDPADYYLPGYVLLRDCADEARNALQSPFHSTEGSPDGDEEEEKSQLQSVILDACVRRFKCQRIYLRATAAMRWVNSRQAVLGGRRATSRHAAALQNVDSTLRQELAMITDERVHQSLMGPDRAQGKYLDEDPSLEAISSILGL